MKPAAFDYYAPRRLDDVVALLDEIAEDASLLAGGQSLVPMLNMRLARPRAVIDLNHVAGLDEIEPLSHGGLRLGAMVRQRTLEKNRVIGQHAPLLAEAVHYIAHPQIRTRGTIGGSLAHADPAAELPAVMLALDALMLVRGSGGADRSVRAADFFRGVLTTALGPGEMLIAVELPPLPPGAGCAFVEFAEVHGAFALAGVASVVGTDRGHIDHARIALCGVGPVPLTPTWLGDLLVDEEPSTELFEEAATRVREEAEVLLDSHTDGNYRSALAGALTARALASASAHSRNTER
jgi:aerobic carbon-monoxide dehydrogenase medium subunit